MRDEIPQLSSTIRQGHERRDAHQHSAAFELSQSPTDGSHQVLDELAPDDRPLADSLRPRAGAGMVQREAVELRSMSEKMGDGGEEFGEKRVPRSWMSDFKGEE